MKIIGEYYTILVFSYIIYNTGVCKKKNLGSIDRILRVVLAAVIVVLYVMGQVTGTAAIVLGILAAIILVTAAIGICPLYVPIKLSTIKDKK